MKGNIVKDGVDYLDCLNPNEDSVELVLNENEYISNIYGYGGDFICALTIETNFYRKIKIGQKKKEGTGPHSKNVSAFMGGMGEQSIDISQQNISRFSKVDRPRATMDPFRMEMPAGAKILTIAGSADQYFRSIFAYFKI
mmetsp:Transcript_16392/g.15715  ORF Transcript_16392/g.15715 Transcript_16392/m.15715 type:complete len:140 (+) Transcript_16392:46-465(+)